MNGNQANAARRPADCPAPTVHFGAAKNDVRWQREAFKVMGAGMVERHGERPSRTQDEPAFTIRANAGGAEPGGFRIREVGEGPDPRGVRISLLEAAALQSFPPETVWTGTQTQQFTVVGNAVPPLMAEAILGALIAPPAERDAWDLAFAEISG